MKPDISEFSYAYALVEDLIVWQKTSLTAAPIFPSLIKEGRSGGGYDVRLDRPSIPLFLQFRLSDYMTGPKAEGFKICTPIISKMVEKPSYSRAKS